MGSVHRRSQDFLRESVPRPRYRFALRVHMCHRNSGSGFSSDLYLSLNLLHVQVKPLNGNELRSSLLFPQYDHQIANAGYTG